MFCVFAAMIRAKLLIPLPPVTVMLPRADLDHIDDLVRSGVGRLDVSRGIIPTRGRLAAGQGKITVIDGNRLQKRRRFRCRPRLWGPVPPWRVASLFVTVIDCWLKRPVALIVAELALPLPPVRLMPSLAVMLWARPGVPLFVAICW